MYVPDSRKKMTQWWKHSNISGTKKWIANHEINHKINCFALNLGGIWPFFSHRKNSWCGSLHDGCQLMKKNMAALFQWGLLLQESQYDIQKVVCHNKNDSRNMLACPYILFGSSYMKHRIQDKKITAICSQISIKGRPWGI